MKIKIVTGQRGTNIEKKSCEFQGETIIFPESKNCHSYDLCDYVMETIQESCNADRDLIIVTYSEVVLDATRLWIARNRFNGAECINVLTNGSYINVPINENGEMENWVGGVFDIKSIILKELFEIRQSRK